MAKKGSILLGNLLKYMGKAIRFYELGIAPMVFIILLLAGFTRVMLPSQLEGYGIAAFLFSGLGIAVIYLTSAVYLFAYIKELKNELYGKEEIKAFIREKGLTVIMATLALVFLVIAIFIPAIFTGFNIIVSLVCTVAAFSIYITYIFNICFIIDKNVGVADSFKASKKATSGRKNEIFLMLFVFNIILTVPVTMITIPLLLSGKELALSFVITFLSIVINLMTQRFTALMYMRLVYEKNEDESNNDI